MSPRKQPETTRQAILEAAFWEIHRCGFRAASLDNILAETGVTKGALYHHFPNKTALGYAVVEEFVGPWIRQQWVRLSTDAPDPLTGLQEGIRRHFEQLEDNVLKLGCPLNNLAQEMATVDEGFRQRIQAILDDWAASIARLVRSAQKAGVIREEVEPETVARFAIAAIEGIAGTAKAFGDLSAARPALQGLIDYLESLRNHSIEGARS